MFPKKKVEGANQSRPNAHLINKEGLQIDSILFYIALVASKDEDKWWIDSGASNHMTFHREWFCNYKPIPNGVMIRMGDSNLHQVKDQGSVRIKLPYGEVTKTLNF